MLQEARFADIAVVPRGSDIAVAVHKVNSVFYRMIFRNVPNRILRGVNRVFFTLLFAAPVVLLTLAGHLSILLKAGSPGRPPGVHGLLQEDRFAGPDAVNRHLEP